MLTSGLKIYLEKPINFIFNFWVWPTQSHSGNQTLHIRREGMGTRLSSQNT